MRARKAGHAGRNAALAAAIQGLRDGLKGEKALMAAPLALAALEQRCAVPHDPERFCW